jgi:hypothetical protein
MARSFVPFETLWEMALDTPYSLHRIREYFLKMCI